MAYLWVAALAIVVVVLMVMEQIALLYVLATLGVTALLVVVAMADLRGTRESARVLAPADDAAAIGAGISNAIREKKMSPAKRR